MLGTQEFTQTAISQGTILNNSHCCMTHHNNMLKHCAISFEPRLNIAIWVNFMRPEAQSGIPLSLLYSILLKFLRTKRYKPSEQTLMSTSRIEPVTLCLWGARDGDELPDDTKNRECYYTGHPSLMSGKTDGVW